MERLYNSNATRIKCQVGSGTKDDSRDSTDWIERQANALNALAPKIQIPRAMFKTQAFEFIKLFLTELGIDELIDVMEPVIDTLATFDKKEFMCLRQILCLYKYADNVNGASLRGLY